MAETSYDGGIGGKFRKRPSRRASSTPYDRPPTAIRPTARAINSEGERSGWLSKFVDSAPKLLMSTASKLFPFRSKQLGAPNLTQAPDSGVEAGEEAIRSTPDSSSIPDQSSSENHCKESPNADSMTDFEKMLGQKTFTRTEVDRLTELLRSRTVGSSKDNQSGPNGSTPDAQLHTEENLSVQILEKRVSEKEIASPAELAKAYMGSRPSKLSTPLTGLQSLAFGESTPLSSSRPPLPKTSDLAVAPRSMVRLSGLSEDGYKTPRSQGRSAIYKMSRSPYFKTQSLLPAKGIEISNSGARAYNSYQLVPAYASDVKQVLKRRSSPMDTDVGSFGPIRRIRQKSNVVTQENEVPRKYLSSPANNMLVSTSSIQKPFHLDAPSHNTSVLGDTPGKSSQMAAKIFKQLDLLGSPPKEKASELDTINKDESPTKLSINMLRGQASMSLKDIDTSKLFNFEENKHCSTNTANDHTICIPQKVQRVESNGPIYSAAGTSRAGALDKSIITATAAVSQKKPGFMMQVPETSSDGDAENPGDTRSTLHTGVKPSMQPSKAITFEVCQKKPPSPETESSSGSALMKESVKKSELPQVPSHDNGFSFPVTSTKSSLSQPPPTPTMPLPTLKPPVESQGEGAEPVFSFGSGKTASLTFSAIASDSNAIVTSDPNADMFVSISTTRSTQLELPKFTKGKDTENSVKSFQNSTSSIFSGASSPSFNFGASASSGLSNGSLRPMPSIFSASASPVMPVNGGISVAAASSSCSPTNNIGSSSINTLISAPAVSSTSTSVGLSTTAITDTAGPGIAKSATKGLEVQSSSKDTIFPTNNDLAVTTAAAFASSGTSIFGLSSAASASTAGSTSVQSSGSQKTNSLNGGSMFGQSTSNAFGAAASSSTQVSSVTTPTFGFTTSGFGSSSNSPSPFSFGLSSGSGQDTSASFPGLFGAPSSASIASSMTTPSLFSSSGAGTSPMAASSLFSSSGGTPLSPVTIPTMFGSSSQSAASSIFSSGATSSTFSFGQSAVAPSSFGSSGSTFSFTSAPSIAAPTSPSPASLIFGTPAANTCASASSPGNDQMNVEDSMADDTVQGQVALLAAPAFGQAVKTNTPSTYSFGSPQPSGSIPFQFGSQPSSAFPAAQSSFQPTGNFDLGASGSFSLGSGGGDKSARKMIRVRKDNKNRKK